jgi:uncharacterized protein (TIGR00369 family)
VSELDAAGFRDAVDRTFPGLVGVEVGQLDRGRAAGTLEVREHHLTPHGYLHAGAVVTFADTICGYGCIASLPEGRSSFTTIELKANFVGTARSGTIRCDARLVHGGRTTQVWDATVTDATAKTIAVFRCTQLLLSRG